MFEYSKNLKEFVEKKSASLQKKFSNIYNDYKS